MPGDHIADATRYAAHYGLPPLETVDDVITLLVTAEVLHEIPDSSGRPRLHPAHPLPFPGDVLPLSAEEERVQRELRMVLVHSDDSFEIIGLFEPDGRRLEEVTTSLQRLARVIDGDPRDACQAVLLLLGEGDFTATEDVTAMAPHKVFRLGATGRSSTTTASPFRASTTTARSSRCSRRTDRSPGEATGDGRRGRCATGAPPPDLSPDIRSAVGRLASATVFSFRGCARLFRAMGTGTYPLPLPLQ
ncbi:DUF6042 family protein [Kitasatospora purpeofusca]|uniref:DUF6042 family protein n=1 Tax=Kitasatospora purpeofusca TaxID=67352 RepID=UPI0033FEDAB6